MRRQFKYNSLLLMLIFSLFLLPNFALAASKEIKGRELLSDMRGALRDFSALELLFEVSVVDDLGVEIGKYSGSVRAQGHSYRMKNEEMELFCDGDSKWILMKANDELVIMPNDTTLNDIVENPIGFLSNLGLTDDGYNIADKSREVGDAWVVKLSAVKRSRTPYRALSVYIKSNTKLPQLVEIESRDGSCYKIKVLSLKSVPKLDNSHFSFPKERLQNLVVTDLR